MQVLVCVYVCGPVVPDTPHIDVAKCSRSTSSVVLVLDVPTQDTDVIDGYRVFYSTDQERPVNIWVRLSLHWIICYVPTPHTPWRRPRLEHDTPNPRRIVLEITNVVQGHSPEVATTCRKACFLHLLSLPFTPQANHTTTPSPTHILWYFFRFHSFIGFCLKLNDGMTDLVHIIV